MIYRIENIQLVFEDNTRSNIKCETAIIVHDLGAFRKRFIKLSANIPQLSSANIPRKSPLKYVYFTYEEYNDR